MRDGLETLPDPSFEDPSEPLITRAERDTELQLSGDRLNFYGYLPLVQRQHRELNEISQAQDPKMGPFIKQQIGVHDVLALQWELGQREARRRVAARRWTNVSIAFKFLYLLGAFSTKGNHSLADSEEEQDVKKTELIERSMFLTMLRGDLERMLVQKGEYDGMLDELKDQEGPGAGFEFRRIECSLEQTKEEILRLRSKIWLVESDISRAKEGALFLDEDGISSTTGKGKLKESEGATSDSGSQPAMYVSTGRRYGRANFERFDHIASSHVSVGQANIGRVDAEIRLLYKKTKWGIMGHSGTPAAIIYMDFVIRKPEDCEPRSWRIEISLREEISDGSKPKGDMLEFTDFYGPKNMSGPQYMASRVKQFTPSVEVMGYGAGGLGMEKEYHTALSRWQFKGQIFASSRRHPDYETLAWEMEYSKDAPPLDEHGQSIFHVAFAIQHNAHEFYLSTSVTGKLARLRDSIRSRLKFMDSDNETIIRIQFPSRESYFSSNTLALDTLAVNLEMAMELENMNQVPVELPLPSKLSEPRAGTRRGNTTTDAANDQDREKAEEYQPDEEDEEYFTGVEDGDGDEDEGSLYYAR